MTAEVIVGLSRYGWWRWVHCQRWLEMCIWHHSYGI